MDRVELLPRYPEAQPAGSEAGLAGAGATPAEQWLGPYGLDFLVFFVSRIFLFLFVKYFFFLWFFCDFSVDFLGFLGLL